MPASPKKKSVKKSGAKKSGAKKSGAKKSGAKKSGDGMIRLPADCDILFAEELLPDLRKRIEGTKDIHMSAEKVERITTPMFQMLVACAQSLHVQGRRLVIASPSAAMQEAARVLNLSLNTVEWEKHYGQASRHGG